MTIPDERVTMVGASRRPVAMTNTRKNSVGPTKSARVDGRASHVNAKLAVFPPTRPQNTIGEQGRKCPKCRHDIRRPSEEKKLQSALQAVESL